MLLDALARRRATGARRTRWHPVSRTRGSRASSVDREDESRLRLDFIGRGVPCGFVSRHAGAAWRHRRGHSPPRHLRVGVRGALALPLRRCQALHAYAVQPPRREIFHEDLVHSALPLDGRLAVKPREGTVWG